ncbi:MAG: glycosyltransferase family 4 protein [bacterium]|nr:glycosyltransferase family 4 protein [bacterium]
MTILIDAQNKDNRYVTTLVDALTDRGYVFLPLPWILFLPWYRFIKKTRILIATGTRTKITTTLFARMVGMKIFWIETRLVDRRLSHHLFSMLYHFFARFVTIVVVSRIIRQQLIDRKIPPEQIHVVTPGIALENHGVQKSIFRSMAETKTKRRVGFSIGAISALEKAKGLEYLLQAFSMAHESIPELHLTIVGHGTEKTALQWVAKKLHIEEHVLFVGWQEHTDRWLSNFDLIVAPQIRKEGFGELLLVAMAYAKPIIATDVGSFPEIIERRKTGIIIEAGNASMLAEAIVNLYHHPDWREEMGRKARERVEEYFSLPRMVNAWDVLLRHEE